MSIALTTTQENEVAQRVDLPVDIAWPDLQAAISGNLAKLSAEGQVKYYNALCKFTGLNPLGFPFEWITFQGKLKLYPKKECADQLRGVHKITAKIIERTFFDDICMVRVMSKMPDGREFESTGAVPYAKTMPALERCKALKVAETQAYRRGTFGLVGLGNLVDEDSETPPSIAKIETLGEDSVHSRAEKANLALTEGEKKNSIDLNACSDTDKGGVSEVTTPPPRSNATAGARALSQEPTVLVPKVQPPIEATAPVNTGSPVPQGEQNPISENEPAASDDFDAPPSQQQTEEEKKAADLEAVFGTAKAPLSPLDCYEYLIAKKQLTRGAGLETVPAIYALKVISNAGGFMRSVEAWVKGGRK